MTNDAMSARLAPLTRRLDEAIPAAIELRREIHANPYISGEEGPTAALVAAALGAPDAPDVAGGRVIRIGAGSGPSIAIRAELDALPIQERTDVAWRSTNGAMHACGHDVHLAALTAVAHALAEEPISMVALLQPREEAVPGGALDMVKSGALEDAEVRAVIGAHVHPQIAAGQFSAYPGVMNASSDEFTLVIRGRGGHGAYPHATADPIVASATVINALQQIVSRRSNPMEPTVITVGSIHGGTAANAIPDEVTITGTIRAYDAGHRHNLHTLIGRTAEHAAALHDCQITAEFRLGEPALRNDEDLAERLAEWAHADGLVSSHPLRSCGADDFAFYGEILPSVMTFVGAGNAQGSTPELHSAEFLPEDRIVRDTARIMIAGYLAACDLLK